MNQEAQRICTALRTATEECNRLAALAAKHGVPVRLEVIELGDERAPDRQKLEVELTRPF
jgi:hypothetical protein